MKPRPGRALHSNAMFDWLSRILRRRPLPGAGMSGPLRHAAPAGRKDSAQESAPAGEGLFWHTPWHGTPSATPEASECGSAYASDSSSSCDSGSSSGSAD